MLALVHLQDAAAIAGTDGAPGGLRLKFADIFAAPARVQEIAAALGGGLADQRLVDRERQLLPRRRASRRP